MATRGQVWLLVLLAHCAACCRSQADVVIDLTYIGNPGNPADSDTGSGANGSVAYGYYIGTYEVTVAQYTEFLNSVAQSDPYGLYNASMTTGPLGPLIVQSGTDGSYTYAVTPGTENQPVRWVSDFDAMRFSNWMSNGQGSSSTETGMYNMAQGDQATRTGFGSWAVPTLDEWYKAAYYDPSAGVYYDHPNGTDLVPAEPADSTTPRPINFGDLPFWQGSVVFTSSGETTGQSPYGTFDQGGNVREWTDTIPEAAIQDRVVRGGYYGSSAFEISANASGGAPPSDDDGFGGFRLTFLIPEPSTIALLGIASAVLLLRKRSPGA